MILLVQRFIADQAGFYQTVKILLRRPELPAEMNTACGTQRIAPLVPGKPAVLADPVAGVLATGCGGKTSDQELAAMRVGAVMLMLAELLNAFNNTGNSMQADRAAQGWVRLRCCFDPVIIGCSRLFHRGAVPAQERRPCRRRRIDANDGGYLIWHRRRYV